MRPQEVLYNVAGQSWFYDVSEGRPDGAPTPTVTIVLNLSSDDTSVLETATTGAVALDSVNTTASAGASRGDVSLTLASATGVVKGRRYLFANTNGQSEWIEVASVIGLVVRSRRPVANDYAIGSTFVGCRLTVAVNATWMADRSKISDVLATTWRTDKESAHAWGASYTGYRLRWSYSVGGSPTISQSYGDLVRYTAKNLVTPVDVDHRFPGWIDRLAVDYQEDQGASLIDEAFYAVRTDALADGQALRRIRNTEILRELVVYRANLMACETAVLSGATGSAPLDEARRIYAQRYDQLMREPKFQADQIGDGAAGAAQRLPVWRR